MRLVVSTVLVSCISKELATAFDADWWLIEVSLTVLFRRYHVGHVEVRLQLLTLLT